MDETLTNVSNLIKNANKILILTGAGISTNSGIPDFRSKTGIYNIGVDPEKILSRNYFFQHPQKFYDFFEENFYFPIIDPNDGHKILSKWEKQGIVHHIITQNVDGLHQKAGSQQVIEFHGTSKTATCYNPKCKKKYTIKELLDRKKIYNNQIEILNSKIKHTTDELEIKKLKEEKNNLKPFYVCDCGKSSTKRYIKPDIVLYGDTGQWFSSENFHKIRKMIWEADLILVLGTTLKVYPFSDLVRYRNKKIPIVIINKGSTPFDNNEKVYLIKKDISNTLIKLDNFVWGA
jgi:NAD-dependent deacetylase